MTQEFRMFNAFTALNMTQSALEDNAEFFALREEIANGIKKAAMSGDFEYFSTNIANRRFVRVLKKYFNDLDYNVDEVDVRDPVSSFFRISW